MTKCKYCGRRIAGRGPQSKYCSHACRQRAYELRKLERGDTDGQTR